MSEEQVVYVYVYVGMVSSLGMGRVVSSHEWDVSSSIFLLGMGQKGGRPEPPCLVSLGQLA